MDSPTVSIPYSLTTGVKYVFVSSNTVTIFKIILINVYDISNQKTNQTSFLFVMLNLSVKSWFSYNFYNFNWVRIDMSQVFATFFFMMLPSPRFIYSF